MQVVASRQHQRRAAGDRPVIRRPRVWLPTPAPMAVPPKLPAVLGRGAGPPRWSYLAAPGAALTAAEWGPVTEGTVVALPANFTGDCAATLLTGIRQAVTGSGSLLLVHTGAGGGSLLAALHRELPMLRLATIEITPTRLALAAAQALASAPAGGVCEATVDAEGLASTTRWAPAEIPTARPPVEPGDLVVVTGGLGGLGCAVAQWLAKRLGVHPVLLDAADPTAVQTHQSLAALRASGRPFTHVPVDVTDEPALRAAFKIISASRPVRAVVHCAGVIDGGFVHTLELPDLAHSIKPKVDGLRAVLSALDLRGVRQVLAFGSIVARAPHPRIGAYALANELLRREVDRWVRAAPGTRFLTAEWSIWDGAGVAFATGQVGNARRAGYEPIPLADGLRLVERLLAWRGPQTSVLVSATRPGEPVASS